jgi:hypothetical protein
MSKGPIVFDEPIDQAGPPFYRYDLDAMPDDGRRYEIVDGTLIVSAVLGRLHQRAALRIATLLDAACPSDLEVVIAPFSVAMTLDTVMEPRCPTR